MNSEKYRLLQPRTRPVINHMYSHDIQRVPDVADPIRRGRCKDDLALFCETYFPSHFSHPFNEDQLKFLRVFELQIKGDDSEEIPRLKRNGGQSTIIEIAALWSILCQSKRHVCLVADNSLDGLIYQLSHNKLLGEDFPEACYPITCLDGIYSRTKRQTCGGLTTEIVLRGDSLIRFPRLVSSRISGAVISFQQNRPQFGRIKPPRWCVWGKLPDVELVIID